MKHLFRPVAVTVLLVSASSCFHHNANNALKNLDKALDSMNAANDPKNTAPPVSVTYNQLFDSVNFNKNVEVEGYVELPSNSYQSDGSAQLDFFARKGQFWAENTITLDVNVGTGNNTMKSLPAKYTKADLVITDNNGNKIGAGDYVKVTGQLSNFGTLDAVKVEKETEPAIDYSTLSPVMVAGKAPDSTLTGKLLCAEGTMEMPSSTLDGDYTWLYLHVKGISDPLTIHLHYGQGPNNIEPLPSDYSDSDVKIHDKTGALLGAKQKVRVYGVFDGDAIEVENIETR